MVAPQVFKEECVFNEIASRVGCPQRHTFMDGGGEHPISHLG